MQRDFQTCDCAATIFCGDGQDLGLAVGGSARIDQNWNSSACDGITT
jgi:hypothetical protein